jgi:hypothetical protein
MSVTIELSTKTEANLTLLAAARGLSLATFLEHLLEEQLPSLAARPLSPAERAAAWRESAKKFPYTRSLDDEAIGRASFYAERG